MSDATTGRDGGGAERAWRWSFRALLAATLLMVNALLAPVLPKVCDEFAATLAAAIEESHRAGSG